MSALIDLRGKRFGRWIVTDYAQNQRWSCICDCGVRADVDGFYLRSGTSKSCGCLQRELAKAQFTKHGMTGSREYRSWESMKSRCFNPKRHHYENYGGRGISVCKRWANSFEEFFADMGPRPAGCSLDRIDPSKGYTPANCRWADAKLQRQNQRPVKRHRRADLVAIHQYARALTAAGSNRNAVPTAVRGSSATQET
jgi:hypothetical protein